MKLSRFFRLIVIAFLVLPFASAKGQIALYESPCKSIEGDKDEIMAEVARYGESDNPKIVIVPNSNRDRLEIKLDDEEVWDLLILSCEGKLIRLGLLNPGMNKISFSELDDGVYFVYMSKGEERWVKKVKKG